jgi:SWI/SNF-related matrix-associated actin-dependent regulator 1 of chromatin subfamily A
MPPLDLFPYQETGAAFLASKDRGALFDDMGIGKSAQAIRAMDDAGLRRGLIVCPAAVRETWAGEIKKFARRPRKVIKGRDIQDLNLWLRHKVDVLLLSYEMASAWAKRMEGDLFDFLILDESHYLKSKSAARTIALLGAECDGKHGLARWAAHVWFLTGTPNPNDVADIWSAMRFCKATPLSHRIFTDRYFTKRVGTFSSSYACREAMVPELKQAIASFSLRRTKKDVNLQLPPIWLTTTVVDGDTTEIRELLRQYPNLEQAIREAVDKGGLSFLDAQHIATLRRLVGEAKAPAFVELLLEELRDGMDKVVVFGIHRRALDSIASGLDRGRIEVVRIDGSTSDVARSRAVRCFQDGSARVLLGNIKAAGTGLTLTAAADVIMFESDWTPAGNAQALMRVHRIGQDRAVHARFITLANSIDEQVAETVARKTASLIKLGTLSEITA